MDDLETAFSTDPRAQQVFITICNALDHLGLNRHTDTNSDGSCTAHAGVISDEFRLRLIFTVRHQIDSITLIVALPFTAPIPRRMWAAAAVCAVNLKLFEGLFEYNMEDGSIFFRMTENYYDAQIGEQQIRAMCYKATHFIDKYGIKLRRFCEGVVTLEEFLEDIKRKE